MKIEFDAENFDPITYLKSNQLKLAYVLAISWFVDCAISLKSQGARGGSNFEIRHDQSSREKSRTVRYVPTPQFSNSVRRVQSGDGVSPVLHHVAGHIRQLPEGFSPSDDAVGRAPSFLRKNMGSRDTYVVGHTRGIEKEIDEFVVHLSKYSMTAHAFAAIL
jgi:hypothetical protein